MSLVYFLFLCGFKQLISAQTLFPSAPVRLHACVCVRRILRDPEVLSLRRTSGA